MARIEVREFDIGMGNRGLAIHQFLVKYNDQGQHQELHGVAVNQYTRNYNSIATGKDNLLKAAAYPPIPHHPNLTINQFHGLYTANQSAKTLFEGSEKEVNMRWDAAINAAETINARTDLKYLLSGGSPEDFTAGNSNTVAAALEKVMGFTPIKIGEKGAPGLNKNILSTAAYAGYENLYNSEWGATGDYHADNIDEGMALIAQTVENCIIS